MVSVIMSSYNESEKILRESIESILEQSYSNLEFIIILDNPMNQVHRSVIEEYAKLDCRIVFKVNEENRGIAQSLNDALQLATGDYICRMDADDVAERQRIEWQKEYLEVEGYDLVGGLVTVINIDGEERYKVKKLPYQPEKINKLLCYNQCIPHPCWFARREVFDALKGYRIIDFCEDYDFTLRAALAGYKISNVNRQIMRYRVMEDGISRKNLYEQYLYTIYLGKCYKMGKVAEMDKAREYVGSKMEESLQNRYIKASYLFDDTVACLQKGMYFSVLIKGLKLLFCSSRYCGKIYRYARVSLK